jgi:hypothetical protein
MTDPELVAYLNLYGVVLHAIGNLNMNDPPAALKTLMEGLEFYNRMQSKSQIAVRAAKEAA